VIGGGLGIPDSSIPGVEGMQLMCLGRADVKMIVGGYALMLMTGVYLFAVGRFRPVATFDVIVALLCFLIPGVLSFYYGWKSQHRGNRS